MPELVQQLCRMHADMERESFVVGRLVIFYCTEVYLICLCVVCRSLGIVELYGITNGWLIQGMYIDLTLIVMVDCLCMSWLY